MRTVKKMQQQGNMGEDHAHAQRPNGHNINKV